MQMSAAGLIYLCDQRVSAARHSSTQLGYRRLAAGTYWSIPSAFLMEFQRRRLRRY
jgi:hypothetical protein